MIVDDVLADTASPSHVLEGGSRVSATANEFTEPLVTHASSPGHSTELSSALSSPPDSPVAAPSSATSSANDLSASCHGGNAALRLTDNTAPYNRGISAHRLAT